jgi:uncharacterized protein YqjF (DUF2071 family)
MSDIGVWKNGQAPPAQDWVMTQQWDDLLFAHWPVSPAMVAAALPAGLDVDTCCGSAWLGVVPFRMDRIQLRGLPSVPGFRRFPELNLRTYVRDTLTGTPGVYFFSLDATNPFAVFVARSFFQLPYYWARMRMTTVAEREFSFTSTRLFSRRPIHFAARYRGLGPTRQLAESRPGSIEHFLTERYCLFTQDMLGRLLRSSIRHIPWTLEAAEAEITCNDLVAAAGMTLPNEPPLLYYSRHLAVYVWQTEFVAVPAVGTALPAAG